MKRFCALVVFLSFCALAQQKLVVPLNPVQERHYNLGDTPVIQLVKDGKPNFEIVHGKTRIAKEAATEAADLLGKALGTTLAISAKASGTRPAIIIGNTDTATRLGIDLATMDRDGFVIRTDGQNIVIIGRDDPRRGLLNYPKNYGANPELGSLNGTYVFLERLAGFRFYYPGEFGTYYPALKNWSVPSIDISDRPDMTSRHINQASPEGWKAANLTSAALALNHRRLRLCTMDVPTCHGLGCLGFIQRFKKTHPEYFALQQNGMRHFDENAARPSSRAGHVCFSSGIKQVIIDDADAFLRGKPASDRGIIMPNGKSYWSWSRFPEEMAYFCIMPNDCCCMCRCDGCWPHFSKGPQETSDFIWQFFIDIANALKERKTPGYVTTMAYFPYELLPPMDIPDNLMVMLAIRGPWNYSDSNAFSKDMAFLKGWYKKLNHKVNLWTYPSKDSESLPGIPNYAPIATGKTFAQYAPYIFGGFMEDESDTFMGGAMNFYVFSRVAWDTTTSPEAVMDEFYSKMFGAGASKAAEAGALMEQKWLGCVGKFTDTDAGPITKTPTLFELWNTIWNEEEIGKLDKLFADGEALAQGRDRSNLEFFHKALMDPMKQAREKWVSVSDAKKHWYAVMPEGTWSQPYYLLPVPNKGKTMPLEVTTSVKLKRDNQNFYFLFDCQEPRMDAILASDWKDDDDNMWEDSGIEVHLCPDGSETRYQFMATYKGHWADMTVLGNQLNSKWNSGMAVKTMPTEKGYAIEVTIPRKSMPEAIEGKFKANFTHHRALNNVRCTPYYAWSFFARTFGDLQNFGTILFQEKGGEELLKDPAMQDRISGRFIGKNWFSGKPLERDAADYVTDGSSIVLKDGQLLGQYLPQLKPNTDYVFAFWLKMEPESLFNVRFDEDNGHVTNYPRQKIQGPLPWTRQEMHIQTHDKLGKNPYIRLQMQSKTGAIRLNHLSLKSVEK